MSLGGRHWLPCGDGHRCRIQVGQSKRFGQIVVATGTQAAHAIFALHVSGREVYPRQVADALEAALQPLVVGGLVERLSRHDTNPANNLAVPAEYRS